MRRKRHSAKALTERLLAFNGKCAICRMKVGGAAGLEWDHRVPLKMGGEDVIDNLQPLCRGCHKAKTRQDARHIAKAKRMNQRQAGIGKQSARPVMGSKASPFARRYDRAQGRFITVRRDQ